MQLNSNISNLQIFKVDHLESVSKDIISCFSNVDNDFYPPISQRVSIESYIETIFNNKGILLVCKEEDRIAGVLALVFDHPQWHYCIQFLGVTESFRKKGIGQCLMDRAFQLLHEVGADRVVLRTWSTNAASIHLHLRNGFMIFDKVFNDRGEGVHTFYFAKSLLTDEIKKPVTRLGILGGMGSFSTGNFIKTLTSINRQMDKEQDCLPFILNNEPSIPSRTHMDEFNGSEELTHSILKALIQFDSADLSHLILLCFTLYPFIKDLPFTGNPEFTNLVSFTNHVVKRMPGKWMQVSTLSTYHSEIFCDGGVYYPKDSDKVRIQQIIDEIKMGMEPQHFKDEMINIAKQNNCDGLLLACTDLHGMYGHDKSYQSIHILDPLLEFAFVIQQQWINQINSAR